MEKLENKNKLSTFMNKHGIIFILLVMIIVSTIMEPSFLNYKNLINVFRQISVTGPIAIGMTFVIINGGIDISVGGIVGLAGMVAMILMSKGYGILIALLAALAIGILVGFINGYYVSKGLAPFIVTMSTNTILRGLAQLTTNGQPVWGIANGYEIFGQGYIGFVPVPVIIFLLVFAVAYIILNHTTIGRSVYAVGGNAESSRLSGISILKSKIFVYCISGILSAITAIVLTVIGGTSMSGGEGRVEKTLVGILIIGILSNILNLAGVSPYIQQVVKGLIILGAVVWDNSKRKNK